MRFVKIRAWFAALAVTALVACGGGGGGSGTSGLGDGAGTPVLGGSTVGGPTLVLGISSTNITAQSPATLTGTLRDVSGKPIAGLVVSFKTARTDLGALAGDSALTNAQGMASVGLSAASNGLTGADTVTVTAVLGTTTLTSKISFSVSGATATLQAAIDSTTLRTSLGPVRFSAVVKDASGQPVSGQVILFASATGVIKVATSSALTDAAGVASTTVTPADGSVGAADTLVASTTVNTKTVQSSVNVQVIPESPSISLTLVGNQSISPNLPGTLQATVRDANNAPVSGAVVSFSSQFGLTAFSASTVSTAVGSGIATVVASPKTSTSTGADALTASVTINGVTRTAQRVVDVVGAVASVAPQLQMSIQSSTVTPLAPTTVNMTLLDGGGKPVAGSVITVSTSRGNVGVLNTSTVLTSGQGTASVLLSAAPGVEGADEVVSVATVLGQAVQARVGFNVANSAPTLQIQPGNAVSIPVRYSAGQVPIMATVRSATGQGIAGQVVKFSADNKLVDLSASSAITLSDGTATITLRAKDATTTGAEVVSATASVAGRSLLASTNVALLSESPQVVLEIIPAAGSSVISLTAPATVRATVKDSNGALVPSALVSFAAQSALGVFDTNSAATGSAGATLGQASVKVTPASGTTAGAEVIIATATVSGVKVSDQKVVQFTPTSSAVKSPILSLSLDSRAIDSANPTVVRATLKDTSDNKLAGQVVTFSVVRGLARTNVATALTNTEGLATATLSPASSSVAGADEIKASATVAGVELVALQGFEIRASNVTLNSFISAASSLSAYGQTAFTLALSGASVGSPVNIEITSACVSQGKATLSPSKVSATASSVTIQYRDNGCGAIQSEDQVQAVIVGTDQARSLTLGVSRPDVSSVAFVQAVPEQIFLRGSGFAETSVVRFEVRDGAGNPLPRQTVSLELLTGAGGVTVQNNAGLPVGVGTVIARDTDDLGRVEIRVNAGTAPTPVRIQASLSATIKTVSSNLSVGVGLPSQLNFSLAQGTRNIEGFNIDGTPNTYNIIASDRSGNPVPAGTSVNFVTEGGQIEPIKQTQLVAGLARTTAQFISASPRPADGRVTITAYALGEESFIDQNGNNVYDPGEPFQDLGNVFKDRWFDGKFNAKVAGVSTDDDEYVVTNIANSGACRKAALELGATPTTTALLALDASIPSVGGFAVDNVSSKETCDGVWSGAGKVYVRRAIETVLSTSAPRLLWPSTSGLDSSCQTVTLQTGPVPTTTAAFTRVLGGETWYGSGSSSLFLNFTVADANTFPTPGPNNSVGRLNPMAAGTTVTASTPTTGLKLTVGGTPVPNTSEASAASVGVGFDTVSAGVVLVTLTSPSGLGTTYAINVQQNSVGKVGSCP